MEKIFRKKREQQEKPQEPPNNGHCTEEVKHIAPTDILGTSGMGKAMELWREG